jgi:dTDP-glucose pyrophosphorylase
VIFPNWVSDPERYGVVGFGGGLEKTAANNEYLRGGAL